MGLFKSKEEKQKQVRKSFEQVILSDIKLRNTARAIPPEYDGSEEWRARSDLYKRQGEWMLNKATEELPLMSDEEVKAIWSDRGSYYNKLLKQAEEIIKE